MTADARRRLSELLLEELSEKLRNREGMRRKLEAFVDLPVEKAADAILDQFEHLVSADLLDLILQVVQEPVAPDHGAGGRHEPVTTRPDEGLEDEPAGETPSPELPDEVISMRLMNPALEGVPTSESIMEHFGTKEPFPTEPIDFDLNPLDWFYLYGFSYAPDSSGKGTPEKKLAIKGTDRVNNIFIIDYGDVRLYVNKMNVGDYVLDKSGAPTLNPAESSAVKFGHERVLNLLRSEDVLVPAPFWTVLQGHSKIIRLIEDRYVELLRALIDVHDITEWDIDVLSDDEHFLSLPSIAEGIKHRPVQRESRHVVGKVRDIKLTERVIFKEKSLAQEIHNELLIHSVKSKVDYMIRLDSAIMGDWKSILSARYTVGKEKRRTFFRSVETLQRTYNEFRLLIRVTNPTSRFSLVG